MSDTKTSAETELSAPVIADYAYGVLASGPTSGKISLGRMLGLLLGPPQMRLTLESGVPVSTTDQTAKGTLYYTPSNGNVSRKWDGTRWLLVTGRSEISLALTITSGKNYDVFDSGSALSLSNPWTDDVTRADALGTQDGVACLGSDHTKLHVGTIRASGTNTTEDSGAFGNSTTASKKRFVWNLYNRVIRPLNLYDETDSWTYGTATWRSANGSNNNRVEVVNGALGGLLDARIIAVVQPAVSGGDAQMAFGENSTSTPYAGSMGRYCGYNAGSTAIIMQGTVFLSRLAPLGYTFWQWLEFTSTAKAYTIYGDAGSETARSGIDAQWPC